MYARLYHNLFRRLYRRLYDAFFGALRNELDLYWGLAPIPRVQFPNDDSIDEEKSMEVIIDSFDEHARHPMVVFEDESFSNDETMRL